MAEHAGANNIHTRRLAEFVAGVRYEQIPMAAFEPVTNPWSPNTK